MTSADVDALLARADPEVVVHLAAAPPDADAATSAAGVLGAARVARACARTGARLVLASAGEVYGEPAVLPAGERAAVRPLTPYAAAMVAAEAFVQATADLHAVTLRLGTVYGPGARRGLVHDLARSLVVGQPGVLYGDGSRGHDLVHVDDVTDAVLRCLGGKGEGRRLNIGTGTATTERDLHRHLATVCAVADAPEFAAGGGPTLALESGAARRALGWEAAVPLEQGLAQTVDGLRANPAHD